MRRIAATVVAVVAVAAIVAAFVVWDRPGAGPFGG